MDCAHQCLAADFGRVQPTKPTPHQGPIVLRQIPPNTQSDSQRRVDVHRESHRPAFRYDVDVARPGWFNKVFQAGRDSEVIEPACAKMRSVDAAELRFNRLGRGDKHEPLLLYNNISLLCRRAHRSRQSSRGGASMWTVTCQRTRRSVSYINNRGSEHERQTLPKQSGERNRRDVVITGKPNFQCESPSTSIPQPHCPLPTVTLSGAFSTTASQAMTDASLARAATPDSCP